MGAYVSISECKSHYNITINCDYKNGTADELKPISIGGKTQGAIPTDPDVAGIGVS